MKYLVCVLLLWVFSGCESQKFDRDVRQIIAKDQLRSQMHGYWGISITDFKEDTLQGWPDPAIGHPIRYTLNFKYKDSTGPPQNKKAVFIFTPEGNVVLNTRIMEP